MDHSNFHRWWRDFSTANGFGRWVTEDGREIKRLVVGDSVPEGFDGVVEWRDADGISCDESGRRYSRSYKKPKLKRKYEGFRYHETRHTHFTFRLADGMDIPTAQALGGWSDPRVLLTTYAHPIPENVLASAGFMDNLMRQE